MMMPNPTAASAAATVITIKQTLPGDILKETSKRNERQVHGVEHQLDAHEHRDDVSLNDDAHHADREQ
jgi:hypothetical protein